MVFLLPSCTDTKQVKDPNVQAGFDASAWVSASNKQLLKVPVKGFAYKSSKVPSQRWDRWAKSAAPVVKGIINKLPSGYVLQITGHTDARGPEQPEGNKPGNIKISENRAKSVFQALKKNGITSPEMVYKGVGSSDPIDGVNERSASQRRVTFLVVPE